MASIFILIMVGLILSAASSAPAPVATQKPEPQPLSNELKLPDGYIFFAQLPNPPKPVEPPKKQKKSQNNMVWNVVMGIVFILFFFSLLIMS